MRHIFYTIAAISLILLSTFIVCLKIVGELPWRATDLIGILGAIVCIYLLIIKSVETR